MSGDLRYPIGPFVVPDGVTAAERGAMLGAIAEAPARLRAAVTGLDDAQLDRPYRPGGWTVRQVAHHVPDSHMGAYARFKLALHAWHGRHHVAHVTRLREREGW